MSLFDLIRDNDVEKLKVELSTKQFYLNDKPYNILTYSCICDKIECAKIILESGIDINGRDNSEFTLFETAIYYKNKEFIELCIEKGATLPLFTLNDYDEDFCFYFINLLNDYGYTFDEKYNKYLFPNK